VSLRRSGPYLLLRVGCRIGGFEYGCLEKRTVSLLAQLAVHHALYGTETQLVGTQSPVLLFQLRFNKFMETMYGELDNTNKTNKSRWQKIRELNCASLLLISVSYSSLEFSKMHRLEFDYLMENVTRYLRGSLQLEPLACGSWIKPHP
jgi:hypothetical protein